MVFKNGDMASSLTFQYIFSRKTRRHSHRPLFNPSYLLHAQVKFVCERLADLYLQGTVQQKLLLLTIIGCEGIYALHYQTKLLRTLCYSV